MNCIVGPAAGMSFVDKVLHTSNTHASNFQLNQSRCGRCMCKRKWARRRPHLHFETTKPKGSRSSSQYRGRTALWLNCSKERGHEECPPHVDIRLYEALGISPSASQKDIKLAFRRIARAHHPDVQSHDASLLVFEVRQPILSSMRWGNSYRTKDKLRKFL